MPKNITKPRTPKATAGLRQTAEYRHKEETPARPDVGTQPQFKKRAAPRTWRYDSSLAPALDWDTTNPAREQGEALIAQIERHIAALRSRLAKLRSPAGESVARGAKPGGGEEKPLAELQTELQSAQQALKKLKTLSKPFLNWSGKAERLSFDVPTLPLFVHERLSTRAILETLKGHHRDKQLDLFDLFSDPQRPIHDQVLRAYEYQDKWVNRMILGDSLVVMNSLLHYESMGGQVQMIYMDPPYGVKFGSNFQPFVRKRDVSHGDDDDMTREPEMVQAYRDTWELGLHSYLTYLRDRLLLSRELLAPSGSIFVQISDENLHHVREVMDEVFGAENFVVTIVVTKKGNQKGEMVDPINDYILWFAKDKTRSRSAFQPLFQKRDIDEATLGEFNYVEFPEGRVATIAELSTASNEEIDYSANPKRLFEDFPGVRLFDSKDLTIGGVRKNQSVTFEYEGREFDPGLARGVCWKHTATSEDGTPSGMDRLVSEKRLYVAKNTLRFKRYIEDFPYIELTNLWNDLGGAKNRIYAVQTNTEIVKRCMLMTTRPGDLVIDPTCGSGTTAYVAEQWGRRWITADTSRVPLALARQRLLTATFPWYALNEDSDGPSAGFKYLPNGQSTNPKSVGPGIVKHITSSTIANDEPADLEVLVDRPELFKGITRVTGPFVFEATIPTVMDIDGGSSPQPSPRTRGEGAETMRDGDFIERMLEVLRRSPVLRLEGNRTVTLKNMRRPAKTLSLTAEAMVANGNGRRPHPNLLPEGEGGKPVALVFGPENGAIVERLVYEAAREATAKNYAHLYVIGFAIQPTARQLVDSCEAAIGIAATYVQATPDLMMGDLLKNMRSSQIFSVCGLPEIALRKAKAPAHEISDKKQKLTWYEIELLGLDVFDPGTMEVHHKRGDDVPAWFIDTDYNGLSFHVCQAFFPRTAAWDSLKRALKGEYEDAVWQHLAGKVSVPFEAGEHGQIAVKVIDDRGNELMVVKSLKDVK